MVDEEECDIGRALDICNSEKLPISLVFQPMQSSEIKSEIGFQLC